MRATFKQFSRFAFLRICARRVRDINFLENFAYNSNRWCYAVFCFVPLYICIYVYTYIYIYIYIYVNIYALYKFYSLYFIFYTLYIILYIIIYIYIYIYILYILLYMYYIYLERERCDNITLHLNTYCIKDQVF